MNPTILAAIKQLSSAKRVELYNILVNKEIKKFASVEAGISLCTGAAKAAGEETVKAAFAQIGVPLDTPQGTSTEAPAGDAAPAAKSKKAAAEKTSARPESNVKSRIMQKIEALKGKPKKTVAESPAGRKATINKIKPTFAGTSKPQAASRRAAVLAFINENKRGITVEALNEHFKEDCRGFVQKLLEKNHVEVME